MGDNYSVLNNYLVEFFNDILRIEENSLAAAGKDLSLREMHTIEAVIHTEDNNMGSIAAKLNVTMGTLSVAVKTLEQKGYIERRKQDADRRQVNVFATEKGRKADALHQKFHKKMVSEIISGLTENELEIFMKGLEKLNRHFYDLEKL